MDNNQKRIRRDLLYVYEALYVSINRGNGTLFDKNLVKKLKYTPEQIIQALELGNSDSSNNRNLPTKTTATLHIKNDDELRNFYYSELKQLYDNTINEEEKAKIINSISLEELKRLYSIISNVSLPKKTRKKDIVDMLRYYFSDEARTSNLAKKL